jgi:hypothetical protein
MGPMEIFVLSMGLLAIAVVVTFVIWKVRK